MTVEFLKQLGEEVAHVRDRGLERSLGAICLEFVSTDRSRPSAPSRSSSVIRRTVVTFPPTSFLTAQPLEARPRDRIVRVLFKVATVDVSRSGVVTSQDICLGKEPLARA